MNEIMFFFLSILSVCGSAFIQGFLTLAEAGQRSTFTFILFPPFKEKNKLVFFPSHTCLSHLALVREPYCGNGCKVWTTCYLV